MGSRSSRLQKRIFPRSKTKLEAKWDKVTGNNQSYPSVPASTLNVKVDPEPSQQYSSLLKGVAGNIQSRHDNHSFKEYDLSKVLPSDDVTTTPRGFLDKEMLTKMFISEKDSPDLHNKLGLTEEELLKIKSCYAGFVLQGPDKSMDGVREIKREANEVPGMGSSFDDTPAGSSNILRNAEARRIRKDGQ